jgi:hypothetical protein
MVTFLADNDSGDPYMQIVPPAIDAGPASGSFSFSPITASASALVTSLQASISPELLDDELVGAALLLLPAGEAALLAGLLFELHEAKAKRADNVVRLAIREQQLLRRTKGAPLSS